MKGYPKFKNGQVVKFEVEGSIKEGLIYIVDKYGTFEDNSDVSYDILVSDENCLYKHIREDKVKNV
jgi:ribosomal protein L21E